ncbi:hypothetical protein [Zavarzinella formosa]|uniref:hypothetical protein n=1 Tax=Zavarzinella formosa TaxID=360055 RepID=UPI0004957D60|nr:hypothetical protein [Zavarzinella formosa]
MRRYRSRLLGTILAFALTSCFSSAAPPEKGGDVKPAELAALIDRADKLVVLDTPLEKAPTLYESKDRKDLDSLKAAMKLRAPERGWRCSCYGTPAVALYEKGKQIGLITNHHGVFVRCNLWASDAALTDSEPLLKWFDDRKIPGPRKEFDLDVKLRKQADADKKRWLAAMPPSLKPHWEAATRSFTPDLEPMQKALAEQVKDKKARILALAAWFGSGAGPWSGYPVYESVAGKLLLGYSTAELLEAVKGRDLSKPEMEGVARLFGGWDFSQQRPDDLALVPAELKAKLLKHSMETDDEDKRGRARRSFGK